MDEIFYTFTTTDDANLAYHVPDKKENVDQNRKNLAKKFDFELKDLIYMNQVHGNNVVIVDKDSSNLIDNCDAIISKEKGLVLMVMVADCIPILLFDETNSVIAAVHAGRNSTFEKIVEITAKKMIDELNCKAENIKVIMGPSIGLCCYEVSQQLAEIVENSFGKEFVNGRYIDLHGINKKLLMNLGIKNIDISDVCTKCSNKPYFSFREDKECGRFAGIIGLK